MSITVNSITKEYGTQRALDNVSFSVGAGQIVGFLGPNGAGKSTMMKILTCFLPPTQGTAEVCGFSVQEQPLEVKRRVGYLPEHNPLYVDQYVREYLGFVAGVHGASRSRIAEVIEQTGLLPEAHKTIGQLSKGYRQRVGLAQALLHHPEVLILDEPTTGLDPNQLVDIRKLIRQVGANKTVLLSTHIMQEVEALCDRVIIINKGVIVADRPTADLKALLGGKAMVVEFDQPVKAALMRGLEGVKAVRNLSDAVLRFEAEEGADIRGEIFRAAVFQKRTILSSKEAEGSLEDVFRELTRG